MPVFLRIDLRSPVLIQPKSGLYRVGLRRLVSAPVDERAVDVEAVRGPVLRQRQRLVPVRRLALHPLEHPLRLTARAHADHVRACHRQEVLERVGAFNLKQAERLVDEFDSLREMKRLSN